MHEIEVEGGEEQRPVGQEETRRDVLKTSKRKPVTGR